MTDDGEYYVNVDDVANSNSHPAIIRVVANHLLNNQYLTLKDFLKNISDRDLLTLVNMADELHDEEATSRAHHDMTLLTILLAQGEGVFFSDDKQVSQAVTVAVTLFCMEQLCRRNLIEFYREKASFDVDLYNEVIARRIK